MTTAPKIEIRPEQSYIGFRTVMAMNDFAAQIPAMTTKVSAWLAEHGARPSGKPFLRYRVIDMPGRLDVELGIPIDKAPRAKPPMENASLPAGRYAVLTYQGVENGMPANKQLLEWIAAQGEMAVSHDSEHGEVFKARYETFLTDAKDEPDQGQWETEVAIKLRDGGRGP